jgi:UDP-N-acetylglucosamine 1-carboxyvinyltransferase
MGASIRLDKQCATIQGRPHLTAAHIMATDLRASGGLVLAGLVAKGETTIHRIYHLDRGYEELERKLHNCGAIIHRVSDHNEIPEELAYSMQQHDLMAANG